MIDNVLLILTLLRDLGWSMYLGIVLGFTLISLFQNGQTLKLIRTFQHFGVVLGLSLGSTILPAIALIWFQRGTFTPSSQFELIAWIIGLCMWVSNIILEDWTLDPLRKEELGNTPEGFDIKIIERKSIQHLRIHGALVILTHTLCWLSIN